MTSTPQQAPGSAHAPDGAEARLTVVLPLLLGTLPAIGAGFVVLSIAAVDRPVWTLQAGAVLLMLAIALTLAFAVRSFGRVAFCSMAGVALVLCAMPPWLGDPRPARWLDLGAMSAYVAPVVLPAAILAIAHASRGQGRWPLAARGVAWLLAFALAWQPDLSQVLALTAAALWVQAHGSTTMRRRWLESLPFAAALVWAAAQQDPLTPVAHVELVVAMAWAHSCAEGAYVSVAIGILVGTLAVRLAAVDPPLAALALYAAVLFLCSLWGMTPAPLVGHGAGPLLGFGWAIGIVPAIARGSAARSG